MKGNQIVAKQLTNPFTPRLLKIYDPFHGLGTIGEGNWGYSREDAVIINADDDSKGGQITTLEIPDSVREIGECAFDKCQKLAHVEIGPHTMIGPLAFHECPCENDVLRNSGDSLFDNTKKL